MSQDRKHILAVFSSLQLRLGSRGDGFILVLWRPIASSSLFGPVGNPLATIVFCSRLLGRLEDPLAAKSHLTDLLQAL
ncbi:hypothetical protein ACFSCZ_15420 [Siminovitchia sediminis]|uniref:Uncharacterized protein n=1 Tax=Siminovitchia sediminis TaxID=1274353 RepID=A0ABW4KLA4_9BACI